MSNYCQILLYEEFDFGADKQKLLNKITEKYDLDWTQHGYIHFSFNKYYWKDVLKDLPFDWAYVVNDCSDEGGFVTYSDFIKTDEALDD